MFETQSYFPQFVPKSNRDQQKKIPKKKPQKKSNRGGLGESPGGGAEVVCAKPQAEVQRWWPTKKVVEGLAVDGIILAMGFVGERCGLLRKHSF